MFLKSLTLKGFKSFADTTVLDLEPGVTVVVGPNGSGKSNVVDAIAWVLGAQAPSAVRSQKMDDVIFAGTAKRTALGRAEVSLTIDNSAGLLPIEFTEVTITRTLFRTGDSEYAINGSPVRLLDVQELLSDTGVGRQQHVIVSQGQIDAVLNARPEDRRAIIEEAAGVLKYRRRKEKAERRLQATEANLTRVTDLLREVRRQLRPLERQADAARRHGAVVAELRALQLHVIGRELVALETRRGHTGDRQSQRARDESERRSALAALDGTIMAIEGRLAEMGGDDLGDTVARYEALRERARGLSALLAERRRAIERERSSFIDQAVVASLETEAANLARELAVVDAAASALMPDAGRLADAETELGVRRAAYQGAWGDGVAPPSGEAAELRGTVLALRASIEQAELERARVQARVDQLASRQAEMTTNRVDLQNRLASADGAELGLVDRADRADAEVQVLLARVAELDDDVARLKVDEQSWASRADALDLALDEARDRAGARRLAGIDGVLGTLLELIEVDAGWETPVEVALGEALSAVVVADPSVGRRAVQTLRDGNLSGALLVLAEFAPGAAPAAAEAPHQPRSSIGDAVRPHVRSARADVNRLLDTLLAHAVRVDSWDAAVEASLAHPAAVIVTAAGDRVGPTGWRVGQRGTGATGAARDEARTEQAAAAAAVGLVASELDSVRSQLKVAEAAAAVEHESLDAHDNTTDAVGNDLQRLDRERQNLEVELAGLAGQVGELADRLDRDTARVAELEARRPGLEAAEAHVHAQARAMAEARDRLEEHAAAVNALRTDLEVRAAGIEQRRDVLRARHAEVERRLGTLVVERDEAGARRLLLDRRESLGARLDNVLAGRLVEIDANLGRLRDRRRRQSEAVRAVSAELETNRRQRQANEAALAELRELAHRDELELTEIDLRLEAARQRIRVELDSDPDTVKATECPPLAAGVTPPARIRELERDLKLMGPINPLALQEFEELQQRHQLITDQLDDVRSARRDLARVIRSIDDEIVSVFAAAYADVAVNFERLFETLFPGGQGKLRLTQPDNLLDTGIELEARPSGKNVKKLSLLSGGERSLTALAYLFAVFRARPSPFYVMDEVEAALDDVNLHRFLSLIDEFRNEAQLMIVSHQKRTMEAADILYGVSMQPGGSSKVVSEKAEGIRATPPPRIVSAVGS